MVSDNIRSVRKKKNLTQGQLAALIGVSQNAVHNWENGKRQPKLETLKKIAAALNISVIDLLDPEERQDYLLYLVPGYENETFDDAIAAYTRSIVEFPGDEFHPMDKAALDHFRPLSQENKEKALDYMDYLKERQDKE